MAKNAPLLLTQAQYARSRKARGLSGGSREAVRRAVDAGRISAFGPDKQVDPTLADRQWAANTQVRANTVPVAPPADSGGAPAGGDLVDLAAADPPLAPAGESGADSQVAGPEGGQLQADPEYQRSRSRQAAADARTAEIKLAELEGSLVRIDQVKAELAAMLAPVREGLLQIPARLAPLLAPQSDAARIQTVLEVEIHQVLAPLSRASALQSTEGTGAT